MGKLKIKYRKLGKANAYGQYHPSLNLIELDTRLVGKKHLSTLIHELQHYQNPDWSETEVSQKSIELANFIWTQLYRRIDNRAKQRPIE